MLGSNKRPARMQLDRAEESNPLMQQHQSHQSHHPPQFGVGQSEMRSRAPTTPNVLQQVHGSMASPMHYPASSAGSAALAARYRPSGTQNPVVAFIRRKWGAKCTITLVLLLVLAALIGRHQYLLSTGVLRSKHTRDPLADALRPTVTGDVTTFTEPIPVVPAKEVEVAAPAEAGPAPVTHVHPPQYEWPHTLTSERRPPNFYLNGDAAQYNEEKLTPVFERPRVASLETPGLVTAFVSPNGGKLKLSVLMSEEGKLGYMLDVARPETLASSNVVYVPLLPPAFLELNANFRPCVFSTNNTYGAQVSWSLERGESFWRPVPGNERRHFHEKFQQVRVWCVGSQCVGCEFVWEYRLYEQAVAIRAVVDGSSVRDLVLPPQSDPEGEYARLDFGMGIRLPLAGARARCYGQNTEEPYEPQVTCDQFVEPVMTPVTIRMEGPADYKKTPKGAPVLPYRYLSVLQADGPAFMRSTIQTGHPGELNATSSGPAAAPLGSAGALLHLIARGEMPIHALEDQVGVIEHPVLGWATPTSWNVIFVGESPADLAHQAGLIYLLCPPPSPRFPMSVDSRWVPHGKSLRVRGHSTAAAKYLVDFAATYNYQLVHFDAGWYGEETLKTSDARIVLPEFAKQLSLSEVSSYAMSRGVGTSVYVNEIALRDTLELIDIYPHKWGLNGIKFGFVDVNTPRAMRVLTQRVVAFQHVGMFVNIHDIYRPRGHSRTWPHLVTQEGVRGEERKPDPTHHTILPFVRLLQGAADYTPRFFKGTIRCTRAHQLALPLLFFSPIQSLFWAEPGQAIVEAVQLHMPELVLWQIVPTTWDDTRWLGGEIGEYALVARRSGADWFVGAVNNEVGEKARTVTFNLSSLFDNTFDGSRHPLPAFEPEPLSKKSKGWMIHYFEDDHSYVGNRTGTNANNVRVKIRQQFILPAAMSTAVHFRSKPVAIAAQGTSFPSDPVPAHLASASETRRNTLAAQEKQLDKLHRKATGKARPAPITLKSPIFNIKMSPSGGAVMFITPIV